MKFQNVILLEKIDELPTNATAPSRIHVKIADFGIFGSTSGTVAERHNAGSIKYMSPELLQGDNQSDPNMDIWALGVLMFSMIIGECPFDGPSREKIKETILNKEVTFEHKKLLLKARKQNGSQRISIMRSAILPKAEGDAEEEKQSNKQKASGPELKK